MVDASESPQESRAGRKTAIVLKTEPGCLVAVSYTHLDVYKRQHPSVILWDVRVSDSDDVDPLYYKTSRLAKELDVYRQTGGVRDFAGSRFFEDVYLYDDMSQDAGSALVNSENICQDPSKSCILSLIHI